jgi:sugar/nucleoside kinase (ribokinase family)
VPWKIAVAGTLHRDDASTPVERHESFGGSAVYFALAAARHAPVLVNGIVGSDTVEAHRELFEGLPVDTRGLIVGVRPTFRWHVVHDFDHWVTAHEYAEEGCDPEWIPSLNAESRDAEVLFLASLRPELQRGVREQSRARLIGADSMTVFIASRSTDVRATALASDVLFLNVAELAALTGEVDWRRAAETLLGRGRLRAVVVKRGPEGAACVMAGEVLEVPAHPVARVVDPTGAGDALAGGFLGVCAGSERDDVDFFATALQEGVRSAAAAITAFGAADMRQPT